jgi:release factor glutamine methyltransferase
VTAADAIRQAIGLLERGAVPAPRLTAEVLLAHALRRDRTWLYAHPEHILSELEWLHFGRYLHERIQGRPTQYITKTQEWYGRPFLVTPAVLIPRPETELLVELSLDLLSRAERPLVVDVGTGTGCIALSLAHERRDAEVHATDVSGPALRVARQNARRLALERRVTFHEGDLLEPVAGLEVHLIASNPPYVDPSEREQLAPEVRDHEPALALFPPGDALAIYRRLVPAAARALRPGGALAVEIAPALPEAVSALFREAGFLEPRVHEDLAGRPRVVRARLG